MTNERIDVQPAPLSEPTDPRIAERAVERIREVYPLGKSKCPWCGGRHGTHNFDCPTPDVHHLLQRLEQVTAERDSWRKDCQNITDTLHEADRATAFWRDKTSELHVTKEAAEATIASLRDLPQQIMNLPAKGQINEGVSRDGYVRGHRDARHAAAERISAALASVPSSAVSRTAERQP
jgi:hypothetical protein